MLVVASTGNIIGSLDMALMMTEHEVGRSSEWFPIFKRNCKEVVVTGDVWHSLVSIRGSLFNIGGRFNLESRDVYVGGTRCSIHEICHVCRMGNKTVVDLVLAIDPTCVVRRDDSGWTFSVDFPSGFTPMCYTSKTCPDFLHLAIYFKSLGVMAVDITPVSYTLLWDIAEKCSIEIGDSGIVASGQFHKLEVLNAFPEKTYEVVVRSEESDKLAAVEVNTPGLTKGLMLNFYRTRKRADTDNFYDLRGVSQDTITYLRREGILESGQRVRLPDFERESTVVVSGDTVPLKGSSIYVIPDFSIDTQQFICFEDTCHSSHLVEFDRSESGVKYNGEEYPHGSSFSIADGNGMREVAVVQGSIILVISDNVSAFPGGDGVASQVLSSGDLVLRDLVMRSSSQVSQGVAGESTFGRSSFFVYNPEEGTTTECTRVSHGLNEAGDTGSMTIDVLYTDANSEQSMVNTITSDPTQTSITTRSVSETVTATFNASGLSFDSDNGNIYFGADRDFRIHYAEETGLDPAMLQIQSLGDDQEYVTRFLITAEPP
jgi:hypothetical protein